jgi:hypothetical protein
MIETGRRFLRLKGIEQRLVLEAAAALIGAWVGLRLIGFRRWKQILERLTPAPARRRESAEQTQMLQDSANMIARMQATAERHIFFRANCLENALALSWLLRRRGIFPDLRIGGRKQGDRFEAHAWVEVAGKVLSASNGDHLGFAPFRGATPPMETQIH